MYGAAIPSDTSVNYLNTPTLNEILKCLALTLEIDDLSQLKEAKLIAITLDESDSVAKAKILVIIVHYLNQNF